MVTEGDGRYVVPIIADDGEFSRLNGRKAKFT
mgnify:FL=1